MRPHTPDQVADMKSFVDSQPNGAEHKTYTLDGLEVSYTTVDMGDNKPFNYAVAAFVVTREDGRPITTDDYEIAVSNDVPEELQGIWAWHELYDFGTLGHEAENRCLQTEQEIEASLSSEPERYQRYVVPRIRFYDSLAIYIAKDLDSNGEESIYSPTDLRGCYDAIVFLQEKLSVLSRARMIREDLNISKQKDDDREDSEKKQAHIAQEKKDALNAEQRAESDKNAGEFVEHMREYNIPPTTVFKPNTTFVKSERKIVGITSKYGTYNLQSVYETTYTEFGKGWIIQSRTDNNNVVSGIVLLDDLQTYKFSSKRDDNGDIIPFYEAITLEQKFTRPEIGKENKGGQYNVEPVLESPYAGLSGKSLLAEALINLKADQPKIIRHSVPTSEPEPSPTAWVGRPHTR